MSEPRPSEPRPSASDPVRGVHRLGDRVRVVSPEGEYTGCRGRISEIAPHEPGDEPLGYWVAIDGENGLSRPFLASDLLPLEGARTRGRELRRAESA